MTGLTLHSLRCAFAAIALLLALPAGALANSRLLVVPFGDVSAVSGKMPSPTAFLVEQLSDAHFGVVDAGPIDPIFAATEAVQLCKDRAATGLVIGALDLTRSGKFQPPIGLVGVFFHNATQFTQDTVGAATGATTASGLLNRTAIQAQVKLYYIDCLGKLRWMTTTVAGKTHDGNNIGAGYTEIVQRAIHQAVARLVPNLTP